MKIVGRILVILIAALLVVGVAVALVNNGALGSGGRAAERPAAAQLESGARPAGGSGGQGFGRREGGREGRDGGTFLAGLLKNVGTVALIIAGVVLGQWLWASISTRRVGKRQVGLGGPEKPSEEEFL